VRRIIRKRPLAGLAVGAVVALTAAACSSSASSSGSAAAASASASSSSAVKKVAGLYNELPATIKSQGFIADIIQTPAAPFEFTNSDGQLTGIDVQLITDVGQEIGIPVKITQITDFGQIVPSVQTGRANIGMTGALDLTTREKVLNIVDYFKTGGDFVTLKSKTSITSIADLCGQTVVTGAGSAYPSQIEALSATTCKGKSPMKVEAITGDFGIEAQQITIGRAAALFSGTDFNGYGIQQSPAGTYKLVGVPIYTGEQYGVLVNKKLPALATVIQKALQSLVDDGTYQKILDSYGQSTAALKTITENHGTAS
jgi:polar amino acid transport system substrate-binding protein